jgi:hypothetical protein
LPKPIHLFVSSSHDLALERDVVGQVVAEMPLTLGWQIAHTPGPDLPDADDLAHVMQCDLYVLLLGQDFSAPMGAELQQAQRMDKVPLAYRKRCTRSPSSQDAIRRLDLDWHPFATLRALHALLSRDLLRALLQQAVRLGLDLDELERLLARAQAEAEAVGQDQVRRRRGEAGKSGVILGREVWEDGR